MSELAKPFTGRHMLAITLSFFAVVIGVNGYMAYSSSRTWTGLVVENSYVESQKFDATQKRMAEQKALGWQFEFAFDAGAVRFAILDRDGAPLKLGAVTLTVQRPVGGHDDQTLDMALNADGTYSSAMPLPPGSWDAIVVADPTPHGRVEFQRRFSVK